MKKNDLVEFTATDITTDGRGIGRVDGVAVFAADVLPGEKARVKIINVRKNYAVGKLDELLEKSPLRMKPPCPVFGRCGGCTLQHLSYAGQLEFKKTRVEECLSRIAGIDVPVLFPLPAREEYRYRNKAAFPLQLKDGKLSIGLYKAHSHDVVDVDDCLLQQSVIKIVMSQLRVWIVRNEVSIYDEQTGQGLLRHIVLRSNKKGEIMLVLVINGDEVPHKAELIMLFRFVLPQVKSIILNVNKSDTNVIMGDQNILLHGRDHFFEELDGLEFKCGPGSFLQVNLEQAQALYKTLFKELALGAGDTVLDLFCGVGTITLLAARQAGRVIGVEVNGEAVQNANFNARFNDAENVQFLEGDALEMMKKAQQEAGTINTVIVDPPRKGLDGELIDEICNMKPEKIAYVSCDPATFARDIGIFVKKGYMPGTVQPVDMFPQTTHTEVIAVLKRQ